MRKPLCEVRRRQILDEVTRDGGARVADLARRFDVVPSTIRRDLAALEREGLLRRLHGGAVSIAVASAALQD